ncbi:MAG: carbohydrate-binding domain-containing protein [Oscillospiraceae bacterium]|nr:carbohydrate-binding domain-containing protein [Oscillospiraceae bacterium]
MKKTLSILLVLLVSLGLLAGCSGTSDSIGTDTANTSADSADVDFSQAEEDMFTDRDARTEYDESDGVLIQLNGTSAAASSNSVKISGTTITITEEATYIISGTFDNGMIIVNAPDTAKLQLVLNGVSINSETSAPLYILAADKVFLTLADGTENVLSNGGTFTAIDENNIDAVIFSKQDLTLNGNGSLTVTSPAGHGIVCKDDLVVTSGAYTVNSASHGLDANDSVRITGTANITIDAGKDGIHCENTEDTTLGFIYISNGTVSIEAEGDGIAAGASVQIENGTFDILVGGGSVNGSSASSGNYGGFRGGGPGGMRPGGSKNTTNTTDENSTSMKGVQAASSIRINGGAFNIDSADDSVHSDMSVTINGGTFEIASGDDAIHAEDTLTITAGMINISKSYEGLEALHIDVQGGDIKLVASDDGLNAAGGIDGSGMTGGRDAMFGGGGRPNGMDGGMGGMSSNSNGSIVISGGNLYINSSGDGLDANGTLEISGGDTVVVGPTQGDTATLDYDTSGRITGGTFIGTGASGMAQTFSDCEQGVFAVSVGNQSAGTKIVLKDKDGNTIIEHTPELNFAVVILSSPYIAKGETYTITVGSQSGEFEAK